MSRHGREHSAPEPLPADIGPGRPRLVRAVEALSVAAAMAMVVALAIRPIASYDIGYHLAYGDHFLRTGQIVQTNQFIYTRLDPKLLADPQQLGPGCRFDAATDEYSFVNANWLSQAIFSLVHRTAGFDGLVALQAVLIAAIFTILAAVMIRRGGAPGPASAVILLVAMAAYGRFNLRPEVFGYLVLVGQWALLTGPRFTWKRAAGVIALQLPAANLHSYFLLGIALVGALCVGATARWAWAALVARRADPTDRVPAVRLAATALACAAASMANPWFARGALLPVHTLLYMRRHSIGGFHPSLHTWSTIGELLSPFAAGGIADPIVRTAYLMVLVLAGAGLLVAAARRRWGLALIILGMTGVSLTARRNVGVMAMIVAPSAALAFVGGWAALRGRLKARVVESVCSAGRILAPIALVVGVIGVLLVVTDRFYFHARRTMRFGGGVTAMVLPTMPADWIKTHQPPGRVFSDFDTSSNLLYLAWPAVREMPILTNTWAYPPYLMTWINTICFGGDRLDPIVDRYDVTVAVIHSSEFNSPILDHLAHSPRWAVADVGITYATFVRRDGPTTELAEHTAVTRRTFDVRAHIERVAGTDSRPGFALHNSALLLTRLGWGEHAIPVWRRAVAEEPGYHEALNSLGMALSLRGTAHLLKMKEALEAGRKTQAEQQRLAGVADWAEAERMLQRALAARRGYDLAKDNLELLARQVADFKVGVIRTPRGLKLDNWVPPE